MKILFKPIVLILAIFILSNIISAKDGEGQLIESFDDNYSIAEDSREIRFSPMANDRIAPEIIDPELWLLEGPKHGTCRMEFPYIYYTPNPGFVGEDVITYGISQNTGGAPITPRLLSSQSVINIRVGLATANDDNFLVFTNCVKHKLNVLENDILPKGCDPILTFTQPLHGTTSIDADNNIQYTSFTDYVGSDGFTYTFTCGSKVETASVTLKVVPKVDNINDSIECFLPPTSTVWDIQRVKSSENVHSFALPLVGDLGDGKVEIVTVGLSTNILYSDNIYILNSDLVVTNKINTHRHKGYGTYTLSIADVDRDGKAEIFYVSQATGNAATEYRLYCLWKNAAGIWEHKPSFQNPVVLEAALTNRATIIPTTAIADINGDGVPEILAYNKVFNAVTGELIVALPTTTVAQEIVDGYHLSMPIMADLDNNGTLEVILGYNAYYIDVNTKTYSLMAKLPQGGTSPYLDGFVSVADIDLDGYLDVVITAKNFAENGSYMYVWNPMQNKLIGTAKKNNIGVAVGHKGSVSRAFIGDVDNDMYPEIALTCEGNTASGAPSNKCGEIMCYKYNPVTKDFTKMWHEFTSDESGATTITMFDFDQNNEVELVYRDQSHLRIINGRTGQNHHTIPSISATGTEYPVVVDIDGDGNADILVSESTNPSNGVADVKISRFSSVTPGAWAPARKVWNQHGYSAVNINEDLTVPKSQLNLSTMFPGEDGILGTDDDVRPYNGFLLQQTSLNKNGMPLFKVPEAQIETSPLYNYNSKTDKLNIKLDIKNNGDASLQAPVKITVYKDQIITANAVYTYSYPKTIAKDSIVTVEFDFPNFSTSIGNADIDTKFIVKINDAGTADNDQRVCRDTNVISLPKAYPDFIELRRDDTLAFPKNAIIVDVLANDSIIAGTTISVVSFDALVCDVVLDNNKIKFTAKKCAEQNKKTVIVYEACNGTNTYCLKSELVVDILPCPQMVLLDSCGFNPNLAILYEYPNADIKWQYKGKNLGDTWADVSTDAKYPAIIEGFYRVKADLNDMEALSNEMELVIIEKQKINNKWWYKTSLK